MIMTHGGHGPHDDTTLEGLWANLSGRRLLLEPEGFRPLQSYTDEEEFLSQLSVRARIIPPAWTGKP